jgi:hypothetical protein
MITELHNTIVSAAAQVSHSARGNNISYFCFVFSSYSHLSLCTDTHFCVCVCAATLSPSCWAYKVIQCVCVCVWRTIGLPEALGICRVN